MDVYIDEYMLVVKEGNGTGHFAEGEQVAVQAMKYDSKQFSNWLGCDGLDFNVGAPTTGLIIFSMPATAVTLEAEYKALEFGIPDFTLPAGLTSIETSAFEGIAATIVFIPDTCTSIGDNAFRGASIKKIRIPDNCGIGADVFADCEKVYIYSSTGSEAESYCEAHSNCIFVNNSSEFLEIDGN